MTFDELEKLIKEAHRADYYELLLLNSKAIIREVRQTNQTIVSEKLNMQRSQFSVAYQLLLAYVELQASK